jgi:peptide-methionine (S)-S-oxide reductase
MTLQKSGQQNIRLEKATLAGGCFWCLEAIFKDVNGVIDAVPGYTGGTVANPSYEQVCNGKTGHAEAVQVTYDPAKITYREILEIFFTVHDPTTLNRQGADIGTQYRSAIFYHNEEQKAVTKELIAGLTKACVWKGPIVTQIAPLDVFYPAEEYHRDYFTSHPEQAYCQFVIGPKLLKFRQKWAKNRK